MDPKAQVLPMSQRSAKRPALSSNAKLLLIITTINALALNSVGSLITPYLRDIGMSAAFVGMYFAVSSLVQGVASFIGGFLADSVGRRKIWALGKMFQLIAYAVLAAGLRGEGMIVVAVLSGLSQIGVGSVMALQAEASHSNFRATFFAIVQTANQLIAAVAPLVGGLVADRYGAGWAFFGVLPILLLVARLIFKLEERATGGQVDGSGATRTADRGISSRLAATKEKLVVLAHGVLHGPHPRTAITMLAYTLVNGTSNGAINIGLPLLLKERFGLGYTGIGAMSTVACLGSATCMILGARLADRYGRRRLIVLTAALCAALAFLMPLTTSVVQLYVLIFFATLVGNAANGAFSATNMECITKGSRATYAGVNHGINAVGMALGSLSAGLVFEMQPYYPLLLAASLIGLGALVLALFLEETGSIKPRKPENADSLAAASGDE